MREYFYWAGIGFYVLWLLMVVLLILGQYTPFPLFDFAHSGVVFGAAILAVLGAGKLVQAGYYRLVNTYSPASESK